MLSIDRFEGNYAVCVTDNDEIVNVEIGLIPAGCKEGAILDKTENGYVLNEKETKKKYDEIKKLQDSLWE
jgi:hypothetical protein